MFENKYRLLQDEPEADGATSAPEVEAEATPEPTQETALNIPLDVIPEELRDRSAGEIKYLLNRMADSTASSAGQIKELQTQLQAVQTQVNEVPAEPDPDDEVTDEELMQNNPEKAILRIMGRNGMLDRFDAVEQRAGESITALVSQDYEDFGEHEETINTVLASANVARSRENIEAAYAMSVGMKEIDRRRHATKTRSSMVHTNASPDIEVNELPDLSGLEADIFSSSGMSRDDWETYKDDDSDMSVKVPT